MRSVVAGALVVLLTACGTPRSVPQFEPGDRVLVDAHNAYPENGRHEDRLTRALATGIPLAIEQDLVWCPTASGAFEVLVAHDTACRGDEPTLRQYFFDAVKPIVDAASARGVTDQWPVITLNLDFKMDPPELHHAVWNLLGEYETWLTTAARTATPDTLAPLTVGPLLVLTGQADAQQVSFHDTVPVGRRLRLFGAVHDAPVTRDTTPSAPPAPMRATNYRRWWNHPWKVVEPEGQPEAGDWTAGDAARLSQVVTAAHAAGLWIRFYTLNGATATEATTQGWSPTYNFGSLAAAATRWQAARDAGVDFIATDQYESLAGALHTATVRR